MYRLINLAAQGDLIVQRDKQDERSASIKMRMSPDA
jgi:hypothetical protein